MDYKQEMERLEKNAEIANSEYWKPESGQYEVSVMGEIEDAEPYEEEGKEPQQRKQLRIKVSDHEYYWTMPYGFTPASTFGQLVKIANEKGGLKDQHFKVVVTGNSKSRRYTIVT